MHVSKSRRQTSNVLNMRSALLFLLPALAFPAILPETIGHWQRGEPSAAPAPSPKVWAEYGLQESETSPYSDGAQKYTITAYRFNDATGALAAFYELRPAEARKAALMGLAVETASDQLVAAGNYLFVFKGYKIRPEELSHVVATVPNYEHSPLPSLPEYMPAGATPGSERYIVGPESLAMHAPAIPSSTAAFHFNAEGELARFAGKTGETTLVIFSYPTMEMARDRYPWFRKVTGAVAKRSGPLVALALNAGSPDEAERLLSQVKYQAAITIPEHPPVAPANAGKLFLNIFLLCLILLAFGVLSGVVVGGVRVLFHRSGESGDGDSMIRLRLTERP